MSDKLNWLNQHVVLCLHRKVQEIVQQENYELSSDLKNLADKFPDSEDFLNELKLQKNYKEACRFLAYNLHRRIAVWWVYRCVLDLKNEVAENPAKPRDISEIGKPKPFVIPSWAKEPAVSNKDMLTPSKMLQDVNKTLDKLKADVEKLIDPEVRAVVDEIKAIFDDEQRKRYGMTLDDCMKKALATFKGDETSTRIDPESPIFKSEIELKSKIETVRKETIDVIKSVLPEPDLKKQAEQKLACLDAVYSYIVSPDDENATLCLQRGNIIPGEPEGLLALCAFWSYGNLSPGAANVIKTPVGMFANGVNGLLLMCALQEGGILKPKQRYEKYFEIGYQTAIGSDNWGKSVEDNAVPHKDLAESIGRKVGNLDHTNTRFKG